MDPERQMKRIESATDPSPAQQPVPKEWQFSLGGLMVVTTAVSVIMAFGTYLVGFWFVVFVIVLTQVATLVATDWLIRPANRPALAFVTAVTWITAGSGFLILGATMIFAKVASDFIMYTWPVVAIFVCTAIFCFWSAWRKWRLLMNGSRTRRLTQASLHE